LGGGKLARPPGPRFQVRAPHQPSNRPTQSNTICSWDGLVLARESSQTPALNLVRWVPPPHFAFPPVPVFSSPFVPNSYSFTPCLTNEIGPVGHCPTFSIRERRATKSTTARPRGDPFVCGGRFLFSDLLHDPARFQPTFRTSKPRRGQTAADSFRKLLKRTDLLPPQIRRLA